jgi:FAD/FMN-containing dehydrogenase
VTIIDDTELADLRDLVTGPVLAAGDPALAAEAAAFNLAVTHHPVAVVGATSATDVAAAVRWAAARGLPVAVQATGHGAESPADGAVLITTSRMRGVSVDPQRRRARVAAGALWLEVTTPASEHGLAPLAGSSPDVGVVGYSLGGGIGHLARRYGFAADLVTEVTMVTADGEIRRVDAGRDPELFWAVRGGKANFGIVTEIEFGLVPVTSIVGGSVFFAAESAADVLHAYSTWTPTLPDRTTTSIALVRIPDMDGPPEPLRGRFVVHLRFAHDGPVPEAEALLAPMRAAGQVVLSAVGPMPYSEADAIHQDPTEPGPSWGRGMLLASLEAGTVDALLAIAGPDVQIPLVMVELRHLGGALARQPAVPNAVPGREGAYSAFVVGVLVPELAEAVPAAADAVLAAMAPWAARGALLNSLGPATPEQLAAVWPPDVHRRLLPVKDAVDPGNVFRVGHSLR